MGLHTKEINKIKTIQSTLEKCQKEIKAGIKKLNKQVIPYIQKKWDKDFPGINVHFLTGFDCGCMTNNWKPEIWFYHFNEIEPYKRKFYKIIYNEEDWSLDAKMEEVDAPIPVKNLRNFLKRMSEELGISCSLSESWHVRHFVSENNKLPE